MNGFVDTRSWPLVHLHMPVRVHDNQATELLAQIQALYARAEPFALVMTGAELPRHSARFMSAYTPIPSLLVGSVPEQSRRMYSRS